MSVLVPRDYQEACIAAHYSYFDHATGNPLFVVPTGGGKSLIIAEFIKRTLSRWKHTRILVLTHVKELIEQNHDELLSQWGGTFCPVGIYSAGAGRRDVHDQIIFAGIQSIWDKAELLGHFDLVLIDEAHLVPKKGQGRYLSYLEDLRAINPRARVCGYTATHYRLDGGYLHSGEGRMFTEVAYDVPVELLIEQGYLAPLVAKRPEHVINTEGLGMSAGDFKSGELEAAAMAGECVELAVAETVQIARAENRKSLLFFASGISHAEKIIDELASHDVEALGVFGGTPKESRADTVSRFKNGELEALVNVGVLTTGFNAPRCDLMAVMRATHSASLYVQIMGRGMRIFPGKKDCLVLDYGLNVERHGPINRVKPTKPGSGNGKSETPVKECPECHAYSMLAVGACSHCGYAWPERKAGVSHENEASFASPIDMQPERPNIKRVTDMFFRRHTKPGSPDSMRVDYVLGVTVVSEWVCIEHKGYAQHRAAEWWLRFAKPPFPSSVDQAIERSDEIRRPVAISVKFDRKFNRPGAAYFTEDDLPSAMPADEAVEDIPF